MPQRSGLVTQLDQDRSVGEGPQPAYLVLDGGVYKFAYGGKRADEADAFLKDNGSGVYVLDDDPAEEDLAPLYVNGTVIV